MAIEDRYIVTTSAFSEEERQEIFNAIREMSKAFYGINFPKETGLQLNIECIPMAKEAIERLLEEAIGRWN